MNLVADIRIAARGVDLQVEVPAGTTTAVIGPNGSGKSTLLAAIAGLVRPDRGGVRIGDRVVVDDTHDVPSYRRGTALLAQEPRLFPRMTALANVAFPARARGLGRRQSNDLAQDLLHRMQVGHLADRRPAQLSGGQAQRVAVARALAAEPEVLLLDEPLAALDVAVAADIRHALADVLTDRTVLLVTHDVLDAALLADAIVVIENGRVVEAGPTAAVMSRPRTPFTAELCGLNLLTGTSAGAGRLRTTTGDVLGGGDVPAGEPAVAVFRPAAVAVYLEDPGGSPRNRFRRSVLSLHPQGDVIRVRTQDLAADLTPAAVADLGLRPGTEVVLTVKAAEVAIHPA